IGVLSGPKELLGVNLAVQRCPRADLDYPGGNGRLTKLAGHRPPGMAVLDAASACQLIHLNRWDRLPAPHGRIQAGPPLTQVRPGGQKGGVEVAHSPNSAADLCHGNLPEAAVRLSLHAGSYAHLVEGQQGLLLTAHEGPRLGQESLQEGGVEGEPATEFLHTRFSSSSRIRWPCTLITLVGPIVVSRCESDPCGCTCPCRSSRGRHRSVARRTARRPW